MNRLTWIVAVSFVLTCSAAAKAVSATEKRIADLEAALGEAMIHKDIATFPQPVVDDRTMQNDGATMGTKAG